MPLSLNKTPRKPPPAGAILSLVKNAPNRQDTLLPPHPALLDLVRLMARADARRARAEERGTR